MKDFATILQRETTTVNSKLPIWNMSEKWISPREKNLLLDVQTPARETPSKKGRRESSIFLEGGKNFSRWHFEIFVLFLTENRIWHFTLIVSSGDNLREMSKPVFLDRKKKKKSRKNIANLSSAEYAERVVKVKFWNIWEHAHI